MRTGIITTFNLKSDTILEVRTYEKTGTVSLNYSACSTDGRGFDISFQPENLPALHELVTELEKLKALK